MSRQFVLFVVAMCSLGCGGAAKDAPQLAKAGGVVMSKGQPLANANVSFTPVKGNVAVANTDENGRFTLSTQGRPGAQIGDHSVAITAFKSAAVETDPNSPTAGEVTKEPESLIAKKYGNIESSGLKATVDADVSKNEFTFSLDD